MCTHRLFNVCVRRVQLGTGARRADGAYLIMDAYSECGVQPYGLCHFRLRLHTEEPLPARYQKAREWFEWHSHQQKLSVSAVDETILTLMRWVSSISEHAGYVGGSALHTPTGAARVLRRDDSYTSRGAHCRMPLMRFIYVG